MKTCPYCNSTTYDEAEVCYGCLYRFDSVTRKLSLLPECESVAVSGSAASSGEDRLVAPSGEALLAETTADSEVRALATVDNGNQGRPSVSAPGMARLHVRMPQGYHYDVYLEKPEGASIQIGWVTEPVVEPVPLHAVLQEVQDDLEVTPLNC